MAAAVAIGGVVAGYRAERNRRGSGSESGCRVRCVASGSLREQYRTLRIQPGASEKEVKQAFRKLALQYHPDVCKGSSCGVQFDQINKAYDIIISSLKESENEEGELGQSSHWSNSNEYADESVTCDSSWDLWEEWMGWEGAGIRDYSSHINTYI